MAINTGHDSFADTPWINKLVDYTAKILSETDVRVIGVCFGHQIVGRALKVKVGRSPGGWEAAVNDVQLTERGQELFGVDKLVRCGSIPPTQFSIGLVAHEPFTANTSDAPRLCLRIPRGC